MEEKFRGLKVWGKAHQLVKEVYKVTEQFPRSETYCLVSQMRRAAISIVANIVEGSKRKTNKDRCHFFVMSETSLEELKYYFILSAELDYVTEEQANRLIDASREVGRMLNGLFKSLSASFLTA